MAGRDLTNTNEISESKIHTHNLILNERVVSGQRLLLAILPFSSVEIALT